MAIATDTETDRQDQAPCEIQIRRDEALEALSRAFCDFHRARATLEDPEVSDDETSTAAMRKADEAIGRIIGTRSPVEWRVWSKFALLDWLMTEEGGGLECEDRHALRMIGSIKADLEFLGIGGGPNA